LKVPRGIGGFCVLVTLTSVACGRSRPAAPEPPKPASVVPAPTAGAEKLIAAADTHLKAGLQLLEEGHLVRARAELDKAVDVYLAAPGGAYADAKVAEAYRRTLDTVHMRELEALAAGDGFTEVLPEPASIDEVGQLAVTEQPVTEEERRIAQEAVREEVNDVAVDLNDAVLSCIGLYQGRLREWFTEALARGGRYLPYIRATFAAEGIPQDLAYVALVESAFKTGALSRAKAKGVWQFMPATGREYGLNRDWWIDERSSPEKATRAAAKYLKALHQTFGDWSLALAAYNAGPGKVQRGLDRYKANDYWSLRRTRALKRETKNYVPMIHAAIVVAKAPEKYGFSYQPEAPLVFDTVALQTAVDLRTISECAETTLDNVRLLNPELRRLATPVSFDLNVPRGKGDAVRECLDKIPPERRVRFRTHVVARGQTLASIARRYGVRGGDIAQANALSPDKRLGRGTELIIPIPATQSTTVASARPRGAEVAQTVLVNGKRISYRIKPGDTLSTIASHYGTTVQDLRKWNGLRGSGIAAGETLTIYTNRTF
jgi:membrane-bound lytic murein transglycosylase D